MNYEDMRVLCLPCVIWFFVIKKRTVAGVFAKLHKALLCAVERAKTEAGGLCAMAYNGWRYGLVKADHYRQIEDKNLIQPLLTIPLVSVSFLSVGGTKFN